MELRRGYRCGLTMDQKYADGNFQSGERNSGIGVLRLHKTHTGADSIYGDNYTKLEKPYYIRDLATIDRVPDGTKRCRICQEVKILSEFRTLTQKGKSWLYYACKPCSRALQREAYRRKS